MKYMLLIHQGDAPTQDDPEAWSQLSEDEQKAVYSGYQEVNQTPGVTPASERLQPPEAAKAMTAPEGFSVTLFAGEPAVVQPIAFAFDDRGRVWVAEAYSYPVRVPEDQAKDRILIFEDQDGDGTFDTRKVFAER